MFYEDATAGGLHELVSAVTAARRRELSKPPLAYLRAYPRKGNAKLVRDCATFAEVRFRQPHRADHVFAVIDAYRVEDVVPGVPPPPRPGANEAAFARYCATLRAAVTTQSPWTRDGRARPAATRGRGGPVPSACAVLGARDRHAGRRGDAPPNTWARVPRRRGLRAHARPPTKPHVGPPAGVPRPWRELHKAIDGPDLLARIAADVQRWGAVLDRVPSLRAIVDDLVDL